MTHCVPPAHFYIVPAPDAPDDLVVDCRCGQAAELAVDLRDVQAERTAMKQTARGIE